MNREIVKLLKTSGENYELYAAARIEELESRCEQLEQAFAAAKGYIDVSVCDPDTTAEMWKAYGSVSVGARTCESDSLTNS